MAAGVAGGVEFRAALGLLKLSVPLGVALGKNLGCSPARTKIGAGSASEEARVAGLLRSPLLVQGGES